MFFYFVPFETEILFLLIVFTPSYSFLVNKLLQLLYTNLEIQGNIFFLLPIGQLWNFDWFDNYENSNDCTKFRFVIVL